MIKQYLRNIYYKHKWNKTHPESKLIPKNRFDYNKIITGKNSYGELTVIDFGGRNKLFIGNYVSIAQHVTFVLNGEHNINTLSTYPFKVKLLNLQKEESFGKGDIVISDDTWIGYGATILSGITVGQGAVIASRAVVTKNVPPYAIVGGVPAKVIGYRFDKELISRLIELDFSKLDEELVKAHIDEFYRPLTKASDLSWFPKKSTIERHYKDD